ncbi:MAG: SGNH/GDSL hydrolase family protein [Verrucomicrobiota bacterium]
MKRLLFLCLIISGFGLRAAETAAPSGASGLRVYTAGHSFHAWVAPMLKDLAELGGIKGHVVSGVASVGGSTVQRVWDAPPGLKAREALETGAVDVLTLSPIWLPDEGIEKFVQLGLARNPNLRVTVQEYWLPNDEYNPVVPLDTKKVVNHNATDLAALRDSNARYERDIEALVRDLNGRLGKEAVVVVPVGAASVALRERIVAGKAPGLKVQWRLFTDSWGHPTTPLKVLAAYCHYAVIYRKSPVGLGMPAEFTRNQEYANPQLNLLLQQLAWDAVTKNAMTGVAPRD